MGRNTGARFAGRAAMAAALACALAVTVVGVLAAPGEHARAQDRRPAAHPNIVLIMTDDQALNTVLPEDMPNLYRLLVDRGTTFDDFTSTAPLCCPARATTITGQYGHNNGVLRNSYGLLNDKENVLPAWLQRGGYKTAHLGKWMNGYEESAPLPSTVAPGWDLWFTQLEKRRYYDWNASKNGRIEHYGRRDKDHLTGVTSDQAVKWVDRLAAHDDPFYMQVDFYAPHGAGGRNTTCAGGPKPAPRDEGAFADASLPVTPNFNEEDVSDKPEFIQERPLLNRRAIEDITTRYRCTLESMLSVDRGIARIHREVRRAGELDSTVFLFTSDNGFFFGEHRLPIGKKYPYEENVQMPLTMVVPRAYRDGTPVELVNHAPVANIDLAPTILDLAGTRPCIARHVCRRMDGRSMMPLLDGSGGFPDPRPIATELFSCEYRGIRFDHQLYIQHAKGPLPSGTDCRPTDVEHYDLADDPWELQNLHPAPAGSEEATTQRRLKRRLAKLVDCSGIRGRDPRPESGHYCG